MIAAATPKRNRKLAVASLATLSLAASACGVNYFEIPIETPIQPKLDVTSFQRVLIAGFVAGGTDDVDANQETVRLLRSQLRSKSSLRVIDADVMDLREIAQDQNKSASAPEATGDSQQPPASAPTDLDRAAQPLPLPDDIKNEKDLEAYERLFANTAYWRRIGEEFQNPLIVTGTILFAPQQRARWVSRDVEQFDSFGRRRVVPMRTYMDQKGFLLVPKFVFIDGRTGATLYREAYKEDILYSSQQTTPALSSYFELMDRLVPSFLSALSSQKIRGTRVLLK
jgi:hypothetical protein